MDHLAVPHHVAPTVVPFSPLPQSRKQRGVGVPFSATHVQTHTMQDAAWVACLQKMDKLQEAVDAFPVKSATSKALRDQFERCKRQIQRAGAALSQLQPPRILTSTKPGTAVGTACSPDQIALSALAAAQHEVDALASAAQTELDAPPAMRSTFGIVVASVALALAATALAVFCPPALPVVALFVISAGAAGCMTLPLLVTAIVGSRRYAATEAMARVAAETAPALGTIIGHAKELVITPPQAAAAELMDKCWQRHANGIAQGVQNPSGDTCHRDAYHRERNAPA